ncbi:type VII secretion protein EccB, partial [Mycobacterium tuberculosis]|nr:type VII secretion protein EccB [Mycobacterium tuberculosis]
GRAHPVTNLSSARLITGSPEDSKTVSDSELAKFPRGMLMGIPGAPDDMDPRADDTARWGACPQFDPATELPLRRPQA